MTTPIEKQLPTLWRPRWGLILIGLLCLLAFVPGQTGIPPMDRDEARFAQASKQMLESGDIVTVRFQEDLRAKKPVGIYWLQSLSAAAFGKAEIAAYRLPSLIGGVIVCLVGFWLARQLIPPTEAMIATLMMATSLVLTAETHLAKTDAMLAAVTLCQQALLWRIFITARAGDYVPGILAAGFWAFLAAGILIKGPITPMIAILTVLTVSVGEKNWRWLSSLRLILGFIIVTLLVLPWVVLVTHATDGAFLSTAIKGDLVNKLQEGQESHGAPPLTHLMLVIITFWPGSLILARACRALLGRWRETEILFLLGWVVPFWLVIEMTPTKLPHYMLPIMPGLAMLAALGARAVLAPVKPAAATANQTGKIKSRLALLRRLPLSTLAIHGWEILFIVISLVLGLVVVTAATFYGGHRGAAAVAMLLALAVAGLAGAWIYRARLLTLLGIMVLAAGFHGVTFGLVIPSLQDIHLGPRLNAAVASIDPAPTIIAAAGYHEPSMVFALGTETLLFTPEDAALFISEAPGGIVLIERRARDEFLSVLNDTGQKADVLATINGYNISRGQRVIIEIFRASD
ncbi:MAG: ArnT family glycosyltransferase [Candidatus Puniceispirillales bacterium]